MTLFAELASLAPFVPTGDLVPDPAPQAPGVGMNGITLILALIKWGSITVCGAAWVISGGMIAFGGMSARPDLHQQGKKTFFYSVIGAIVAAIGYQGVNWLFGKSG